VHSVERAERGGLQKQMLREYGLLRDLEGKQGTRIATTSSK
jgi:hypothetical protein